MSKTQRDTLQARTSLKMTTNSDYFTSSITLNTSSSPTKLSQYFKDRSLSRCKDLANMLFQGKNQKINGFKSSTKMMLNSHKNIQALCDNLICQVQNKKKNTKKIWQEDELKQVQKILKKCINLVTGTSQEEIQSSQQNIGSFFETQIKSILKQSKPDPFYRTKKSSYELSSIKVMQNNMLPNTDHIIQSASQHLGALLSVTSSERKSIISRQRRK